MPQQWGVTPGVTVRIIVDNKVWGDGLRAEHGLAMLVETPTHRLLWDAGQTAAVFLHNVKRLRLDLQDLDAIVLSHGHYDHTGGLRTLLAQSGPTDLYAHPGAFVERFNRDPDGRLRPIGSGISEEELARLGLRFQPTPGVSAVAPGVVATGQIERHTDFEKTPATFLRQDGETLRPDLLPDDQSLLVQTPTGLVLLLGCTHAGLVNTLDYIRQQGFTAPIRALIGGLHLEGVSAEQLSQTAASIAAHDVQLVVPLHCSGAEAEAYLAARFGSRFRPAAAGSRFRF